MLTLESRSHDLLVKDTTRIVASLKFPVLRQRVVLYVTVVGCRWKQVKGAALT